VDIKQALTALHTKIKAIPHKGSRASYIPELSHVDPNKFGVFLAHLDGNGCGVGDYQEPFSIQSIAKVLSTTLAYKLGGESIWSRVGVEPSGTAFNSLLQLESDLGIPRNPFINSGAMVICDILISTLENPKEDFLAFVKTISNNKSLKYSTHIAESEKDVGFRNIALCNLIKSFDNLDNSPEEVLDFYFNLCSLEMTCEEAARLFLYLANDGLALDQKTQILTLSQSKRINALMQTCGFYDESGEFSFKVGLPGKSGVGGGILAILPEKFAILVWSPRLNDKGNSYKGMLFLEEFTTLTEQSIF